MAKKPPCKFFDEEDTLSSAESSMKEELNLKEEEKYKLACLPTTDKKKEDSTRLLPNPFPLPLNYRPDVEECLKQKHMTKSAKASFFYSIASAMYRYKCWPSHDEKVQVAKQIELKYPFLGVTGFGRPSYVSC